jgi:hypothetical protein
MKADDMQPIAVGPKAACRMIDCGPTRMFDLIKTGEVESYKDGKSRKILVKSLLDYVERRLRETRT